MEYKLVPSNLRRCARCQAPHKGGASVFYALRPHEESLLEKLSFCQTCWDKEREQSWLCFWKKSYPLQEGRPSTQWDREALFELFFQLFEGTHQETMEEKKKESEKLLYLLALVFVRKRWLRWRSIVSEKERESLVLEPIGPFRKFWKDSVLRVSVPSFQQGETDLLVEKLSSFLNQSS